MSEGKSIEGMVHDYAIAHIQSGKPVVASDIKSFCLLARDIKQEAKRAQKDITEDERRRQW